MILYERLEYIKWELVVMEYYAFDHGLKAQKRPIPGDVCSSFYWLSPCRVCTPTIMRAEYRILEIDALAVNKLLAVTISPNQKKLLFRVTYLYGLWKDHLIHGLD